MYSTRCGMRGCRRRGSRKAVTTPHVQAQIFIPPPSGTNARPNALRRPNRLGHQRGVLSKKKIAVAMATAMNQANATFANRTNWSPFPPVRNVVPLELAVFLAMQRANQVSFSKIVQF